MSGPQSGWEERDPSWSLYSASYVLSGGVAQTILVCGFAGLSSPQDNPGRSRSPFRPR